jgi:D-beta-D-heptose 7-phosphate kinase/D-beta-D-heptose 1-phosphate adenosyltransferase
MLKYAKSLGDMLIVGIDSDDKVRQDKGSQRPINSVEDRKFALECIRYVDSVVVFTSTQGLSDAIKEASPQIMVIGSDWKGKAVIGQEHVPVLKFFDRIGNYSTTSIIEGNP